MYSEYFYSENEFQLAKLVDFISFAEYLFVALEFLEHFAVVV